MKIEQATRLSNINAGGWGQPQQQQPNNNYRQPQQNQNPNQGQGRRQQQPMDDQSSDGNLHQTMSDHGWKPVKTYYTPDDKHKSSTTSYSHPSLPNHKAMVSDWKDGTQEFSHKDPDGKKFQSSHPSVIESHLGKLSRSVDD